MPLTLFPATDEGQISINISLPPGNTLDTTNKIAQQVESVVIAQPEVQRSSTRVGAGSGFIQVQLIPVLKTDDVIARLRKLLSQSGGQLKL